MRYFSSRSEAGIKLAEIVGNKYASEHTAIVALSSGGLVVGAELAKRLHASLFLLPISSVLMHGQEDILEHMTSPSAFSAVLNNERYNIEEITNNSDLILSRLQIDNFLKDGPIFSKDGAVNRSLIGRHNIIVVSDGIANGLSITLAEEFFRPIATKNIVVATPICNADLTEKVHDMTREFFYLENIQSEYPISHYYEAEDIPTADQAVELMSNIAMNW